MLGLLITLVQLLGLVTAARAIMEARTAQGAVAWAIALVSFPGNLHAVFIAAITQAKSRLWIASPYFVPDEQFVTALQLAALRGVEVRILIPERSDNPLVDLSAWSYAMLENDFARSRRVTAADLHSRSLAFRFAVRAARLTAPVQ